MRGDVAELLVRYRRAPSSILSQSLKFISTLPPESLAKHAPALLATAQENGHLRGQTAQRRLADRTPFPGSGTAGGACAA